MKPTNSWYDFINKIKLEWKKLTDVTYFENEDLKKSCRQLSDDILQRDIVNRVRLLEDIKERVIIKSKVEMKYHLDKYNLYNQILEDYERQ